MPDRVEFGTLCTVPPHNPSYGHSPRLPIEPRPYGPFQDAGMRMLIPVGRSGWAIAAGYAGLFSLILIGAPFALGTAILAFLVIAI